MNPAKPASRLSTGIRVIELVEEAMPAMLAANAVSPETGAQVLFIAAGLKRQMNRTDSPSPEEVAEMDERLQLFVKLLERNKKFLSENLRKSYTGVIAVRAQLP